MFGQGKAVLGQALLVESVSSPLNPDSAAEAVRLLGLAALRIGAPIVLTAWVAAYLSHFTQIGWIVSTKSLSPTFRKLNPIAGFKRIFSLSGVVKSGMDLVKVGLIVVVAVMTIMQDRDEILVLPYLSSVQAMGRIGDMVFTLALRVLAILVSLGLIDYLYQRWKRSSDLKMTKQQVKDEMKQSEGDPEVKRRRMRIQRQIAVQRISAAVPKADVIVTNPEHISIAIQYDSARMHAPKVVAKGADFLAMRIRQIAMQHGIPIVERKPLARALYKEVGVNQEVPPEFYKAVAEILAYVFRLNGKMVG
jgi:flagellar biosynthesis protein FlhB